MKKTGHVPYVNIHEHLAPTDESVKILNDFEEKARKNIIHKVKVETNTIIAMGIYFRDEMVDNRVHFDIKFSLNGKEVLIQDYVDEFEWREEMLEMYMGFGSQVIYKLVMKKMAEMIAQELLNQSPDFVRALSEKEATR
jgi:hypothetical protein